MASIHSYEKKLVELGWGRVDGIGWAGMLSSQMFYVSSMVQNKEHWACTHATWINGHSSKNLSVSCNLPGPVSPSIMKRHKLPFSLPSASVKQKTISIIVMIFLKISEVFTEMQ